MLISSLEDGTKERYSETILNFLCILREFSKDMASTTPNLALGEKTLYLMEEKSNRSSLTQVSLTFTCLQQISRFWVI
jgi:hypothetical protein